MKKKIFLHLFTSFLVFCWLPVLAGNITFDIDDHSGSALNETVKIYYNDYGNHWVLLGQTSTGNITVTAPDGTWNFKAVLFGHSVQVLPGLTVPGTITHTFQTAEFEVWVKKSDGSNFGGIATSWNDYGNHWVSIGATNATTGRAAIELFPGTYNFRAYKDDTEQDKPLTVGSSGGTGTVIMQTSKFVCHVTDSDGNDFKDIKVSYNDYGAHYLSMGLTDASGLADIELFPGTYNFRAYKDHTDQVESLGIATSGATAQVEFQTAKATAYVKDCDNGNPIAGIKVGFNDYGNHYLNLGLTGSDGKAYIELFPGTGYKFRANTIYTNQYVTHDLPASGYTYEFNPTRVCFNFSGIVKYNDYGNHWMTLACDTYMFPGSYKFSFDGNVVDNVAISGCSMSKTILLITLKDSYGTPVPGGVAKLGVGGWPVIGTTDANGLLVYMHPTALGNMKIRMTAPNYGGTETSP
jgi:hypothetical protein